MKNRNVQAINDRLAAVDVEAVLSVLGQYVDVGDAFASHQRYEGVLKGGCIAGQAVSSAVQDLYFGAKGGVYNDVDLFVRAREESGFTVARNRIQTAQVADIELFQDYRQMSVQPVSRYKVLASDRFDLLNLVRIEDYYTTSDSTKLSRRVISSFDLNCVQVGIDLASRSLIWTPAFARFLLSRQIEVENAMTPAHTMIRLARKMGELQDVWVDADRVFRTLSGALFRLEAAEFDKERDGAADPLLIEMASLARSSTRSKAGTLYGQRRFGLALAEKARSCEALLGRYAQMEQFGESGRVFVLRPRLLPDESFLRLACRRHVIEYGKLATVFQRPHKPEVRARGAMLLRVDPVSLEPINRGPMLWPVSNLSSMYELITEKVSIGAMRGFMKVCEQHPGVGKLLSTKDRIADQVGVVEIVQACAKEYGEWVWGVLETNRQLVAVSDLAEFEQMFREGLELEREKMEEVLAPRRLWYQRKCAVQVQELRTRAQCMIEGQQLHHCIGGYASALQRGSVLLSLRSDPNDPSSWSSAQIDLSDPVLARVVQHYGPCNTEPAEPNWKTLPAIVSDLAVGEMLARYPAVAGLGVLGRGLVRLALASKRWARAVRLRKGRAEALRRYPEDQVIPW